MKIFLSCSSSDEIKDEYKVVTKYLTEEIAKDNELVFGCANRGLMGISYNAFKNANSKIIGVCYEMYKDDLKNLEIDEVHMVKSLEESNRLIILIYKLYKIEIIPYISSCLVFTVNNE